MLFKIKHRKFNANMGNGSDNQNQGQQGNEQQGANSNSGANADPYANMWDNTNSENDSGNQGNQQNATQQNANATGDVNEVFNAHIKGLSLGNGIDVNSIMTDLQAGKTESLQGAFETASANAYKAALTDMNRVMDAKVAKAVEQATSNATGTVRSSLAIEEMNSRLPYTASKEIKPMADAVFARMMKQHGDVSKAINATNEFFNHVGNKVNALNPPKGRQQGNAFGQQQNGSTDSSESEWMKVLSGINE